MDEEENSGSEAWQVVVVCGLAYVLITAGLWASRRAQHGATAPTVRADGAGGVVVTPTTPSPSATPSTTIGPLLITPEGQLELNPAFTGVQLQYTPPVVADAGAGGAVVAAPPPSGRLRLSP